MLEHSLHFASPGHRPFSTSTLYHECFFEPHELIIPEIQVQTFSSICPNQGFFLLIASISAWIAGGILVPEPEPEPEPVPEPLPVGPGAGAVVTGTTEVNVVGVGLPAPPLGVTVCTTVVRVDGVGCCAGVEDEEP